MTTSVSSLEMLKNMLSRNTLDARSYRGCGWAAAIRYDIGTSDVAVAAAADDADAAGDDADAAAVAAWMSQGAKQAACQAARELGARQPSNVRSPYSFCLEFLGIFCRGGRQEALAKEIHNT